ncbi:hypothetical protein BJ322DRAFT_1084297, partial [Thelephora terrestris]
MGNGSSTQYSQSRHYDYRPFTGPVIPPPSQMTNANSGGTGTGSTLPSYDMPRRRKKWFRFGNGRDRHRGQEVWYSAYVSPRGQQPPTPNIYPAYQRPPDLQRNPSMPVPVPAQYSSLRIPDGYIPPSVNPPVVPHDAPSPTTDSGHWRRPPHSGYHPHHPSQIHHRRPSQSHPPVHPVNPAVIPSRHFPEPTSSTPTSTLRSPPFKPFEPLPDLRRPGPPPPPPKIFDNAPYRDMFSHLSHPSPTS